MFIIIIMIWKVVHVMKEKSPESLAGRFSHWGFQRSALGRLDLPSPLLAAPSHDEDDDDEDDDDDVDGDEEEDDEDEDDDEWWQIWWNLLLPVETPLHDEDEDEDDDVVDDGDNDVDDGDEIFSSPLQHLYMMMMMLMLMLMINSLHLLLMITSLMMTKISRRQRKGRGGSDLVLPTCFWNWGGDYV